MREMKPQFFAGAVVAVLALGGLWTYAFWGGEVAPSGNGSLAQETVQEFIDTTRATTVAKVGQPIEGFEPFMFMRAYPGLVAADFAGVDALIGLYRVENGWVVYDLNGEVELHSAARAISDEGMQQLLVNVAARLNYNLSGNDTVADIVRAIEGAADGAVLYDPLQPATGANLKATLTGTITCLPHKGDGPHTMECAFGLKASDGYHYALQNIWEVAPGLTETGVEIEVRGMLTKPEPGEKYDIAGVLDVEFAEKI